MAVSVLDIVCMGVGEFLGTLLLVFNGCLGCVYTMAGGSIPLEQIAFTFGFAVMYCIQIFAHISGGHLNPAISLAAVILGYLKYYLLPLYIISQVLGGIVGFALVYAVTPSKYFNVKDYSDTYIPGICCTVPSDNISAIQALTVEFMITLVLILVCCAVWDHRNAKNTDSFPIKFGLTIAGLAMTGGHYSGGSMNPARSFGPALINNDWKGHWIYWVGPLLAGAVASGSYRLLFSRPPKSDTSEP